MNTKFAALTLAIGLGISAQANALNIVLTNDDSWSTTNIQTLHTALKAAGHDVIMSAPCTGQSGKGGAIHFMKEVSVDRTQLDKDQVCVGDTDTSVAFEDYTEGTPTMAALYGIDVYAMERWGKQPDLVISGPNEGNNVGYSTNMSGTLGATNASIARGIPAIAVSAYDGEADKAQDVANIVVELLDQLVEKTADGVPLLPKFTGLNVNIPEDPANHRGFKHSQVGWNAGHDNMIVKFTDDLASSDMFMGYVAIEMMKHDPSLTMDEAMAVARSMYKDKAGISMDSDANYADQSENSEGIAVGQGYVTISAIQANVQGSVAKSEWVRYKLNELF
ncbi:5'/3'-nucleotidase SurE [Vibrio sp. SCSIO 43140]|uniref:5'/3'-nucleotidase SurE n=1 Tax=Vibrio sp. SCSIO 43140 TaxID=2819100 RepID=UPI002075A1DE|nr:5'/3'-nucleotidase SurE [Vibrio sp. SCSIO 43140]USD61381.1 5'/3'-nucleotidase SurE [Vibrio sp. SCSIO 43140]